MPRRSRARLPCLEIALLSGFWPELRASESGPGRDDGPADHARFGSRSSTAIPRPKANAAGPTVHEGRRREISAASSLLGRARRGRAGGWRALATRDRVSAASVVITHGSVGRGRFGSESGRSLSSGQRLLVRG